jgi:hypothetical protein
MRVKRILAVAAFSTAIALTGTFVPTERAEAASDPSMSAQLRSALTELANKRQPEMSPAAIGFVHDSTRAAALQRLCANDRFGNELAPNGTWDDADRYGKMYAERLGLDAVTARETANAKRQASWKNGFCHLRTEKTESAPWPSASRQGAAARIRLAIREL